MEFCKLLKAVSLLNSNVTVNCIITGKHLKRLFYMYEYVWSEFTVFGNVFFIRSDPFYTHMHCYILG